MRIKIYLFISLIIIWLGLNEFNNDLLPIFLLLINPIICLAFADKLGLLPKKHSFKFRTIFYCGWLLKEIILSTIAVIKIVWRKDLKIRPVLEPIKSDQICQAGLVVYAASITLTPGTVTLNMQNNNLLIHALDKKFMNDLKEGVMDNQIRAIIK